MITRCNQCGTKFEISAELVQSEDPSVRCGECLSVFDARLQLVTADSISNYTGVSAGRSAGRRHARQPEIQASVAQAEPEVAHAGAADHYAHISDDDLEHAATVVLDQAPSDDDSPDAAYRQSLPDDRINDGFYSPDLSVEVADGQHFNDAELNTSSRADDKIDPSMNLDSHFDNTNLEFERTLALENYPLSAKAEALSPINDMNRAPVDTVSELRDQQFDSEQGTHSNPYNADDQAQREAHELYLGNNWHPDSSPALHSEAETAVEPLVVRDYALATDGGSTAAPDAFEPLNETVDPDRHLSPEERALTQNSFSESSLPHDDFFAGHDEEPEQNQDSASDLRSYVSSRGVDMVSGGDTDQHKKTRPSAAMLKPLLLISVLAAGVLYFARDTIATMNLPAPVLSAFCGVAGCELPLQKDVEQLELIRHQMFSHKSLDDVLVFTVDVINRAPFPQPYPALVVTMANSAGESVAFRKFQPDEYLEEDPTLTQLPAGKPVRIKFEIVDPGPAAMSSELSFE